MKSLHIYILGNKIAYVRMVMEVTSLSKMSFSDNTLVTARN